MQFLLAQFLRTAFMKFKTHYLHNFLCFMEQLRELFICQISNKWKFIYFQNKYFSYY
uniref:Uncharacterized protein n=1 Tax=Heterorhabditis bacteriophora TaxID=37862 RepID=A0A1I7W8R1_HETBA